MKRIAPVVAASLLSAFIAVFIFEKVREPKHVIIRETLPVSYVNTTPEIAASPTQKGLSEHPEDFVAAANMSREAVVSIQAKSANSFWRDDAFNSSSGSGVIISADGYIATNKHVVDEGIEISVTLNDQREYDAKLIGKDDATDLALLKIEATDLQSISFGNSDSLFVGEWVLAIGNPFRLKSTVTAGIVSAKGRNISILPELTGIESFIQTDAAVNPGNSGGALVNTDGELVGINTAIITYSGQYEGFSFAVPSNLARKVLRDLQIYGSVQRGWLGVVIHSIDNELANDLGLDRVAGVYIDDVHPTSAANSAGLKRGDVIVGVNGADIQGSPQFMETVGQHGPGDKIRIEYVRNGQKKKTDVILSSRQDAVTYEENAAEASFEEFDESLLSALGLYVRELTENEREALNSTGLIVQEIGKGSIVEQTNMRRDYIITTVNGELVESKGELIREIRKADDLVVLEGFYEDFPGEYPYAFNKE